MEHLLTSWPKIREQLKRRSILLLLDFDGTLAPLVARPSEAVLPPKTRSLLKKLARKEWCFLVIISERSLSNLKGKVRLDGIIYGGNSGAHLSGPSIDFQAFPEETADITEKRTPHLDALRSLPDGVIMENKGENLGVHYRIADGREAAVLPALVVNTIASLAPTGLVRTRVDKKAVEAIPRAWDKGQAVTWLIDHINTVAQPGSPLLPIYIGDDMTDEDAFAAVGNRGIAVIVGNNDSSRAPYYLKNPKEVYKFLIYLIVEKRGPEASDTT